MVNSTDSYADCWPPFFTLLEAYWPDCAYPIVLNAETASYSHPTLDVHTSRTWSERTGRRPTWSESVIRCLTGMDAAVILYLQDDYFIDGPVDVATVERFARLMIAEERPHIRLRELGGLRYPPLPEHPDLWQIPPRSPYLVSLQAGLWDRRVLLDLLRPSEDPWQFERFGTIRARRAGLRFLCPDLEQTEWAGRPIIPYEPTGIVRGRWYAPAVVNLFARHGIEVDFERRGFYRLDRKERLIRTVRAWTRRLAMRLVP